MNPVSVLLAAAHALGMHVSAAAPGVREGLARVVKHQVNEGLAAGERHVGSAVH